MYDWNGNGKRDIGDYYIGYKIYKDVMGNGGGGNGNGSRKSHGGKVNPEDITWGSIFLKLALAAVIGIITMWFLFMMGWGNDTKDSSEPHYRGYYDEETDDGTPTTTQKRYTLPTTTAAPQLAAPDSTSSAEKIDNFSALKEMYGDED